VCSECHGENGNSASPQFPKLAAQQKGYLENQLMKFKDHSRSDRLAPEFMYGISHALTSKQVSEISDYLAQQKLINENAKSLPVNDSGRLIYENGISDRGIPACQGCHGVEGQGQFDFPRLAGQHKQYLVKQMHVFHSNIGRPDTPMQMVSKSLTEKEIDELATYLSRL
jgi:cytochrome c553